MTEKKSKPATISDAPVSDGKSSSKKVKTAKKSAVKPSLADTDVVEPDTNNKDKTVAKAGKRSAKSIAEEESKQAKEERKSSKDPDGTESKPKTKQNPSRSRLERRGKAYRKFYEQIDHTLTYGIKEALVLATKTNPVKFDASVELHVRLGVDPRQADQNIRDTIVLPAGSGKKVRVAVFADGEDLIIAKKAGADIAGSDEFLQQLDKGKIDFDVLIATAAQMPKLGKYARVLGPKGLMPNPKSGTVTNDVSKAVSEAKAGKVEYRVDSTGIVHIAMGKVSFGPEKLYENARIVVASIKGNKPGSIKGSYIKSAFVTTSMGPSIALDIAEFN